MTILRSLLSLIALILLLNILTGSLLFRQFSSVEHSFAQDVILVSLIQDESRLQFLAGHYLRTQNEQYYFQYHEVLKSMLFQIEEAGALFLDAANKQSIQLIKKKISLLQIILDKYRNNRQQWLSFVQNEQLDKLKLAQELDKQLHSQILIIYQDLVVQTLQMRLLDQEDSYRQAKSNIVKLYGLLLSSFIIVSFFSYVVFQRVSNRIAYISQAAKKLGEGDLAVRIKSHESDDMNYLIQAFNYMASKLEIAEQKQAQMLKDAERQAYHDTLTNLPNRRFLAEQMDNELARAIRHDFKGALIFIDLDNFKGLNDSKGHTAGDMLLIEVSKRMRDELRPEDTLARMGGDEFVVLLPELGALSDVAATKAEHVAEKIKQAILIPYHFSEYEFTMTGSLGISIFPDDGQTSEELLSHSDVAMYQSKERGRNRITFYSASMQERMDSQVKLESLLAKAIQKGTLETWYQAKIDLQGNIVGAEVLARWHDRSLGWISPEKFIPIAEKTGLIIELGKWLIEHVSDTIKRWDNQACSKKLKHLSINISPKQFYERGFIERLLEMGLLFQTLSIELVVEITEGVLLNHSDDVIQAMSLLKENGIQISIDDFGTGYSSMAYLKRLALGEIKIDRSFVTNIHDDKDNQVIVETILSMAKHFGMMVVAEGVEKKEELAFLKSRGCHLYQGYYYSKPLPEDEFLKLLSEFNMNK